MKAKFPLGQVVATPAALDVLARMEGTVTAQSLLDRHSSGDWGEVLPEDKGINDAALRDGDRLLSVYRFGSKSFWIITESDRSATTVLLPSDY